MASEDCARDSVIMCDGQVGGYEVELVNEPPSGVDVFCSVCTLVLRDPVQFTCCTKHLCRSCYVKCTQESPPICPHCGSRAPEVFRDGAWSRVVKGLQVYCRNKQRGCYWKDELRYLFDHLSLCSCEMIACSRLCGLSMERRIKDFHLDNICRLRPFKCEYCSLMGTFDSITGTHHDECQEYPLKCSNQCSNAMIKRRDVKSHMDICPLQEVVGVFSEVGCNFKCQRKDMANHMESSV